MLEVIQGKAEPPKRDWFSYIAQGRPDRTAICDGKWKLIVLGGSSLDVDIEDAIGLVESKTKTTVELFHLDRDPAEENNIVAQHPELAEQLLQRLKEHRRLKIQGVPDYMEGRRGFKAPEDWLIQH